MESNKQVLNQVIEKIDAAKNVLVALSTNPSVDEMAGAIGLTMLLDKMGKHATAIYSGETPNALEFLKPKETFESNVNSLQDFIIALDKEKADHVIYKVDGGFVKIFITPYKTALTEEDLVFSRGEFNVDLVIALNVKSVNDFDNVLREHGRIMHDAGAIDITTSEPGKLGEIEWSDLEASSVCEMIANYAMQLKDISLVSKSVATALLTGIVAATGRFSNEKTKPKTMALASRLMAAGADQQLIAANVTSDLTAEPEPEPIEAMVEPAMEQPSSLNIRQSEDGTETVLDLKKDADAVEPEPVMKTEEASEEPAVVAPTLSDSVLPEVEAVPMPEMVAKVEPVPMPEMVAKVEPVETEIKEPVAPEKVEMPQVEEPAAEAETPVAEPQFDSSILGANSEPNSAPEKVPDSIPEVAIDGDVKDYGKMVEAALSDSEENKGRGYVGNPMGENPAAAIAPEVSSGTTNDVPEMSYNKIPEAEGSKPISLQDDSYVVDKAPTVLQPVADQKTSEASLPMPDDGILPPPPTPPIDFGQAMPEVRDDIKIEEPTLPKAVLDAMASGKENDNAQPQSGTTETPEVGAFKIPGM